MTDETAEVRIRDGETWFVDARALCKRFGGEYISQVEGGDIYVGIPGRGEVPMTDLLDGASRKPATVTSIK